MPQLLQSPWRGANAAAAAQRSGGPVLYSSVALAAALQLAPADVPACNGLIGLQAL